MKLRLLALSLLSLPALSQRVYHDDHHHDPEGRAMNHDHLTHIQEYRKETVYVHHLPAPQVMSGIGTSDLKIQTKSSLTQTYFNQGVALLHGFWDFEAYRAFKEASRQDSTALMPYWGIYSAIGSMEGDDFAEDRIRAVAKIKALKDKAPPHERRYAEAILAREVSGANHKKEYERILELLVHEYPDDVDAKLFLALSKMSGYDLKLNPREGTMYAEYLLRDVLKSHPDNAGAHHYWIHLKENCCPEEALESCEKLPKLGPASSHLVHMPGHVYYKLGEYQKAFDTFKASVAVDSVYMKKQNIQEVDAWNYIHNINYLLANCAEDGRYATALYYAEKLQNMPASKERKRKYEGRFFYQGILAPVKMEICFGHYDRAAQRLKAILPTDSLYSVKAMAYKDGLYYFSAGMDAIKRNKIEEAQKLVDALDATLWRNVNQFSEADIINSRRVNDLNVASLELQGLIKNAQGHTKEAIALLEKAKVKEEELGYSEPPSYARPVLISLGEVQLQAKNYDQAIKAYTELLHKHPNSANGLWGLYKVYRKKGDSTKAKEYADLLARISRYGDKSLYPL
ncbi:tetratricopeptide repeat protein [Siphonobacter sp. SORGH_AS_0500]|uniref:tetratricopeptide repeat protein n=1 Tax=Siphonobacter sp. SORGH_AS_0500 TaxID=1864824 RepID=UPI0028590B9B|nr:tetratricopeptide repeat protein [Siphonobacter sp. SORGH_AS_0500]MDR6197824.1 tetratricopeptide (TPR) repeat protein [Siphonobacter sp. SORGH_AS_0500]